MRLYLGTHEPSWLARSVVPLFVSHRRLSRRRTRIYPRARAPWALDSGGFTELSMYGGWETSVATYVAAVRRYSSEVGLLQWAAPMDWMCEPGILARTGKSVAQHQVRTIHNYLQLRHVAPDLPFIPVLQGWAPLDYLHHVEMYSAAGVDLHTLPLVGLGSVCRRQATGEIGLLVRMLAGTHGLHLHGFGVKVSGLRAYAGQLASADSLAWSYDARRSPPLHGCTHKQCQNCIRYAMRWRDRAQVWVDNQQQEMRLG